MNRGEAFVRGEAGATGGIVRQMVTGERVSRTWDPIGSMVRTKREV